MIRKGAYVLFLRFGEPFETEVGSLGRLSFEAGCYCYVGSAMGGLDQRVSRHLLHQKTKRWHIDYLTVLCSDMIAYEHEGTDIGECDLANLMLSIGNTPSVRGFGCSDCDCQTHLFKVDENVTKEALDGKGMVIFVDKRARPETKRR